MYTGFLINAMQQAVYSQVSHATLILTKIELKEREEIKKKTKEQNNQGNIRTKSTPIPLHVHVYLHELYILYTTDKLLTECPA